MPVSAMEQFPIDVQFLFTGGLSSTATQPLDLQDHKQAGYG